MNNDITKHTFLIAAASLLCILFMKQVAISFGYLFHWHSAISHDLAIVFSGEHWGLIIRRVLALAVVPLAISAVIGGTYWLIKREQMPYLFHSFWLLWLVLLTGLAMQ